MPERQSTDGVIGGARDERPLSAIAAGILVDPPAAKALAGSATDRTTPSAAKHSSDPRRLRLRMIGRSTAGRSAAMRDKRR